jgi:hypothetical protein
VERLVAPLITPGLVFEYLLALFLWVISVTFGFVLTGVAAALAKKHLINDNRYRRKRFLTWTRIILFTPPLFSYVFLRIAGFGSEVRWISLVIVIVFAVAIMYYPETASGFVDWTTVMLDHVSAMGGKLRRITNENK